MELREESLTNENLEKDVTLNEAAENAAESVNVKAENVSEVVTENKPDYSAMNKSELVDAMVALLDEPVETVREAVSHIKMAFYTLHKAETEAAKVAWVAEGNDEAAFEAPEDAEELRLKDVLNQLKEKRAEFNNEQEAIRKENLAKKRAKTA